jgi:hypothetical protein
MIPVTDGGEACAALNQFMRHVRVLSTDRRFVELGLPSYWSILVDHLDIQPESVSEGPRPTKFRSKIDYREVLAPDVFALFAKLREKGEGRREKLEERRVKSEGGSGR